MPPHRNMSEILVSNDFTKRENETKIDKTSMLWRSQHDYTVQIFPCLLTMKTIISYNEVNDDGDLKFRCITMKLCMFQISCVILRAVSTILDLGTDDYLESFQPGLSVDPLNRAEIISRLHENTQAGLI